MSTFNRGERVRIWDSDKWSAKIYLIKNLKKCKKGGTLFLLKPLEESPILRLYYEGRNSLLERIC